MSVLFLKFSVNVKLMYLFIFYGALMSPTIVMLWLQYREAKAEAVCLRSL